MTNSLSTCNDILNKYISHKYISQNKLIIKNKKNKAKVKLAKSFTLKHIALSIQIKQICKKAHTIL